MLATLTGAGAGASTLGAGAGAAGGGGGGGGASFLQPAKPRASAARPVIAKYRMRDVMCAPVVSDGLMTGLLGRDLEFLTRMNQVWVFQNVPVRFENEHVVIRIAVLCFGDFRQAIPGFDFINLDCRGTGA